MIPGIGPVSAKNLITHCGNAEEVFHSKGKELLKVPGVGPGIAKSILHQDVLNKAEKEIRFIEQNGITPLFYTDEDYPSRLKYFNDAPPILYYKGNADLNHLRIVALVGTRKASPYGINLAEKLVEGLKTYGAYTISGLAYGIDIAAHKKSIQMNIPSIGVLGHGLSSIYPAQHRATAEKMLSCGGLLTEYFSNEKPDREHFPMRNRIIAGIADAIVVVESGKKGGSMITAQFGNEYNKDVFAFPSKIGEKGYEGNHRLIKSHRAALIESVEDIAYILRWEETDRPKVVQRELFSELKSNEKKIVSLLQSADGSHLDNLRHHCELSTSEIAPVLLGLELKGLIKPIPGNRYVLLR